MRSRFILLAAVVLVAGLGSRHPSLPWWVHATIGDFLYAVLIALLVRVIHPTIAPRRAAVVAFLFCWAIEFSQLWHPAWLDALRATWAGRLVLGNVFVARDLGWYAVGAVASMVVPAEPRGAQVTGPAGAP